MPNYKKFRDAYYDALRDNSIVDNLNYKKQKSDWKTVLSHKSSTKNKNKGKRSDSIYKEDLFDEDLKIIQLEDILDEFWAHFEKGNYSFAENGDLIKLKE